MEVSRISSNVVQLINSRSPRGGEKKFMKKTYEENRGITERVFEAGFIFSKPEI